MTTLNDYIIRQSRAAKSQAARRSVREDVNEVRIISSLGLDAPSVALPAGIELETRAARMNEFWRALVEFQYRDVVVVALCGSKR